MALLLGLTAALGAAALFLVAVGVAGYLWLPVPGSSPTVL